MKATEFDRRFDRGKDITRFPDHSKARQPGKQHERVNIVFPLRMVEPLHA